MSVSKDEAGTIVAEVLAQMTEDWDLEGHEISSTTALATDLGLSSVDVLTLMSRIDYRLGRPMNYESLVVRDGRFVEDVTVQELVDFIVDNQDADPPEPVKM